MADRGDEGIAERVGSPALYADFLRRAKGEAEGAWFRDQVSSFWSEAGDDYECVDNLRVACGSSDDELRAYEEIREGGCCGFCDVELGPSPAGETYRYGFNHGH